MATAKKSPAPSKAGTAAKKASSKKAGTSPTSKALPAKKPGVTKKAVAKPKPVAAPLADKAAKPKKPKLVRDSFTIPKAEYLVLDELKQRAAVLARPVKKSELLRAGIKALAAMPNAAFLAALADVPAIKTGRPTQST